MPGFLGHGVRAFAASAAVVLSLVAPPTAHARGTQPQAFPGYMNLQGRYLAVLSDADMVASAYLDGQIGPRSPEMQDELALIPLHDGVPGEPRRIPVSNAVTAWPSLLALSGDGRFAYVAETDRPASPGAARLENLQPSPMVRVVDIDAGLDGRVVQEVETAGRAQGLSLRPGGDLLAVDIVGTPRPRIGLLRVGGDGRLSGFTLADLPDARDPPRDLAWSPDGGLLAATFPADHGARFHRVRTEGERLLLEQVGEPVVTGKFAGLGRWTPDARHFPATNLYGFGGAADRFVGSNVSTLTAIRVDRSAAAEHAVVSAAPAGASAENFATSPDGRTIVTLDMENSFLPPGDERLTHHSSLTLMVRDPERERLVARGTHPFEGILPEGVAFDGSGRFVAVADFAHANPRRPVAGTTVDLWRLTDGPMPALVKMDLSIPVMRGAHVVQVQP